ncbi:MAG: phage holin family protein, partial [Gammaproteobacteria bacterium]
VYTRLDILATEVEEEKIRLVRIMLLSALAIFFLCMALVMLSILIVVLFWNDHRIAALSGITLVHILLAIASACWLRFLAKRKSHLFMTSLAELRRDHAGLQT